MGDIPEIFPDLLLKVRDLAAAGVRVRPRTDFVQDEPTTRFLPFAKNASKQAQRRGAQQVRLLDVPVLKLNDPIIDVDNVAIDFELPLTINLLALLIDFGERDTRPCNTRLRVSNLVQDRDHGEPMIDFQ